MQDLNRARAFYEGTFGVKLEALPSPDIQMLAFPMQPDLPGCCGALVKYEHKGPGDGGTLIYFSCEDCATEAARAQQHGGKVVKGKFPIGQYGFIAMVLDPEGNMIGLHSNK